MIILASSSPTRAKILKDANIEFIQKPSNFDEESVRANTPKEFVYKATLGKFSAACKENDYKKHPIVAADTVVTDGVKILRKAKNKEDAKEILLAQSGASITIITCMMIKSKDIQITDISTTNYNFYPFDEKKLNDYLNSDLWQNKAGACMVEGFCKEFIKSVDGRQSTAMGLHVELIKRFLL